MGSKKTRGRPSKTKTKKIANPHDEDEEIDQTEKENGGSVAMYEQSREQRIKENQQRMQKLGILDLSRNLKPVKRKNPPKNTFSAAAVSAPASPRRSTRIKTLDPVIYTEKRTPNKGKNDTRNVEIKIKNGSQPEVYTEEHEKLLGDSKTSWTLNVDGFDEDGTRIYDPYDGKSCHQCRQKTLGHRTVCSKCSTVQGQFCGDCLYMRYGENVLEVNENQDWVCPVCRGICNCSRCRRVNGWEPTGAIYRKVVKLGFKSVAHYLIQTRGSGANLEETDIDKEADLSDVKLLSNLDDKTEERMKDDGKQHDNDPDQDYDYEPLDEDDNDDGDDDDNDDGDDDDNDNDEDSETS